MRERIVQGDLVKWREHARQTQLTERSTTRDGVFTEFVERARAAAKELPPSDGVKLGGLRATQNVMPVAGRLADPKRPCPWLLEAGANRFTGGAYRESTLDLYRSRSDRHRSRSGKVAIHAPGDLLEDAQDLFFDVVLPVVLAAEAVRSAAHRALIRWSLPMRISEDVGSAFKNREHTLLFTSLDPALTSRKSLALLEEDVLEALEVFDVLRERKGDEPTTERESSDPELTDRPGFAWVCAQFGGNVLRGLAKFLARPGVTAAERDAADGLAAWIDELVPLAPVIARIQQIPAGKRRRTPQGGDAHNKVTGGAPTMDSDEFLERAAARNTLREKGVVDLSERVADDELGTHATSAERLDDTGISGAEYVAAARSWLADSDMTATPAVLMAQSALVGIAAFDASRETFFSYVERHRRREIEAMPAWAEVDVAEVMDAVVLALGRAADQAYEATLVDELVQQETEGPR